MPDPQIAAAALIAALAAAALCAVLVMVAPRRAPTPMPATPPAPEPRVFRFRQGYLIDATGGAGLLLPDPINQVTAWNDLSAALASVIPGAQAAMDRVAAAGEAFHLSGRLGADDLHAVGLRDGEEVRITLAVTAAGSDTLNIDVATVQALHADADLLQRSQDASPALSWIVDRDGRVIWGNARYLAEAARARGAEAAATWPLPVLFPEGEEPSTAPTRRSLPGGRGKPERWFEVTHTGAEGGLRHAHAQPLNRLLESESNLRGFIQTLTRAFTALPVGLAVFDAERRLVIHNPRMVEVTGLDEAWLTTKPSVEDVLDALREARRLPEPRDWTAWRDGIVLAATRRDAWEETWTLPDGQSLRLTARTQGGGGLALVFEDVTGTMTAARTRRAEAESLEALLDACAEPCAAFAPDGTARHLNAAMQGLAGVARDDVPDLDHLLARLAARLGDAEGWTAMHRARRDAGAEPVACDVDLPGGGRARLEVRADGRTTVHLSGLSAGSAGSAPGSATGPGPTREAAAG